MMGIATLPSVLFFPDVPLNIPQYPEPDNLHNPPAEGSDSVASRGFGSWLSKGYEGWRLGRKRGIHQNFDDPEYESVVAELKSERKEQDDDKKTSMLAG
jgi:hypothetical protein